MAANRKTAAPGLRQKISSSERPSRGLAGARAYLIFPSLRGLIRLFLFGGFPSIPQELAIDAIPGRNDDRNGAVGLGPACQPYDGLGIISIDVAEIFDAMSFDALDV